MRKLNGSNTTICYPPAENNTILANAFLQFFKTKIETIRASFQTIKQTYYFPHPNVEKTLNEFDPTTEDELKLIIKSHKISCSTEDPLPSKVLKEHIDILLPLWVDLVNLSLSTGSLDYLKSAVSLQERSLNRVIIVTCS